MTGPTLLDLPDCLGGCGYPLRPAETQPKNYPAGVRVHHGRGYCKRCFQREWAAGRTIPAVTPTQRPMPPAYETCPSCDKPINPSTGECRCSL